MAQRSRNEEPGVFPTTIWSNVIFARGDGGAADEMLSGLCQSYWYPIYAFVRRHGHNVHDAQDLTQDFFARIIHKDYLSQADPKKGRFRSFLLTALKWHLANEWNKGLTIKRGGAATILSLDEEMAEDRFQAEGGSDESPERRYDREFARSVFERVMDALRRENKDDRFESITTHLFGKTAQSYAQTAKQIGLSEGGVKTAVRRLRQRCADRFRFEVAKMVARPKDIEEESRYLFSLLD